MGTRLMLQPTRWRHHRRRRGQPDRADCDRNV